MPTSIGGGPAGGRRTGPKPRFTADDAIDAALELGLDSFTLGAVAKELGVSTPSLYRIVESRSDLVELSLARTADSLVAPPAELPWPDQLRHYVDTMWALLENHPGVDRAIMDYPGAHAAAQRYFRELADSVMAAGFPGDGGALDFVLDFLGDTILMTHVSIAAMRREISPGRSGLDQAVDKLLAEASKSGGRTHVPPDRSWLVRGRLDAKVEFIIAGIEAGLAVDLSVNLGAGRDAGRDAVSPTEP
ncbi:TetR/AcrR family transcriptional regulator [Corynebacterium sp. NPDC060344]|uniref:TetR/AcrR family transcriptional regulator n=1 Tax=Corynebacterium sp. NPDC060344 TaxID=3347101 RepID=UPI0036580446